MTSGYVDYNANNFLPYLGLLIATFTIIFIFLLVHWQWFNQINAIGSLNPYIYVSATIINLLCVMLAIYHANYYRLSIVFSALMIYLIVLILWTGFFFYNRQTRGDTIIFSYLLFLATIWLIWVIYNICKSTWPLLIFPLVWSVYIIYWSMTVPLIPNASNNSRIPD